MKWLKRLGNPFALAVEGFLVGALAFAALNPGVLHPNAAHASPESEAVLRQLTR